MDRWIYATDEERDAAFAEWRAAENGLLYRYSRSRYWYSDKWPACEIGICPWCGRIGAPFRMRWVNLPQYDGKRDRWWRYNNYVCVGCMSKARALRRRYDEYLTTEAAIALLRREAFHAAHPNNRRSARVPDGRDGRPSGRPDRPDQGGPHRRAGEPDQCELPG